jgi:triosephosphate isomerase
MVAGNWKMNKAGDQAECLAREVAQAVSGVTGVDVVICPPFTALERVARVLSGGRVALGGQNAHWEQEGAFTGEVSASMLLTCGCRYAILGHSERRQYFGETDGTVNRRTAAVLKAGLVPIVCVGESRADRESNTTDRVVKSQVDGAFQGLVAEQVRSMVIAYEPVWAIGTGLTATPEQAEAVHALIRQRTKELYNSETANSVRILYGGSMKADNARELLSQPDIDGGLIGGASLKADTFAAIVRAAG